MRTIDRFGHWHYLFR